MIQMKAILNPVKPMFSGVPTPKSFSTFGCDFYMTLCAIDTGSEEP